MTCSVSAALTVVVVVVVPSRVNEEGVRWCATSPSHVAELFFEPRLSSFIMAYQLCGTVLDRWTCGGWSTSAEQPSFLSVLILQI